MRRIIAFLIELVLLVAVASVTAQEPQAQPTYATVAALEQTVLPSRDRVDLAHRLLGVTTISAPPLSPADHVLGEQQTFWATNLVEDRAFQVTATLRVIGQHILLWVEEGESVNQAELQALANAFDTRIYEPMRALWGSENSPGIDGDPRLHGLFVRGIGNGTLAYFASQHTFPSEVAPNSNQHEMFMFSLDAAGNNLSALESVMAHEFQHMIRDRVDANEDNWLNEGFSMFTELYLGYNNSTAFMNSFMTVPNTQVNTWTEEGSRIRDYGAALAFVTYLYDRYGLETIQALSADPLNGLASIDHILHQMNAPDVNSFFADWVITNYLNDLTIEDGRYGYRLITDQVNRPAPFATVSAYPYTSVSSVNQYATNYYILTELQGKTALHVEIDAPQTVQLLPLTPPSGDWVWYSNRGDESDTTLTHAFDLSEAKSATLHYSAWYHLENLWDYAYVMVSTDDGATWTPLATPYTTTDDPNFNAYGPGYTGQSDDWIEERLPLDDYVGQKILLRFEMITDTAVTQPGLVIDDVAIPEIGYASDFERDGGGWEAAGWLRTDNRLPQDTWIQAIQQTATDTTITRWQASTGHQWTLPLAEGVEQVAIAISPFAPATTVAMTYRLNIAAY